MRIKRTFDVGRLCALADGIFAIAITLLVLDLKLPEDPSTPIMVSIFNTLHKFYIWMISFFALGTLWIQHHVLISQLTRVDTTALWLNLTMLLFVSVTPWTTSLLGTYHHQPLAVVIFSSALGLAWLALALIWLFALHNDELRPEVDRPEPGLTTTLVVMRGSIVALVSIALAFLNTTVGLMSWLLLFAMQPFLGAWLRLPEAKSAKQ